MAVLLEPLYVASIVLFKYKKKVDKISIWKLHLHSHGTGEGYVCGRKVHIIILKAGYKNWGLMV